MQRLSRTTVGVLLVVAGLSASGCGTGRASQWDAPAAQAKQGIQATTTAAADATAAEADWNARADKTALLRAIAAWEAVVAANPSDGATWARLSRGYYVLADGHLRPRGAAAEAMEAMKAPYLEAFEKGVAAGERALAAVSPAFKDKVTRGEKVEEAVQLVGKEGAGLPAMYWYAVNLGKWSRATGIAALLGNKDRVKGVLERVLALDETFFHGAPHRYFGVYWALLPVGRDLDKSRTHFERSLTLSPNYVGTKVLMAEAYAVKKQDRALFTRLLQEVQAAPADVIPELSAETGFEKEKAHELLAKADELF
jgi:hypothetical protein